MTLGGSPSTDSAEFNGGFHVLAAIAKSMGYHVSAQQLMHQVGVGRRNPTTKDLLRAAKLIGVRARLVSQPSEQKFRGLPTPAMIKLKDGNWQVYKGLITGDLFRVLDPLERGRPNLDMTFDKLYGQFGGEAILIGKNFGHVADDVRFSISWFLPLVKRHKLPIMEMMTISFFINVLALGYPLSIQLFIDKVLEHKSFSTLIIVVSGLVLLAIFSSILIYMRQYLLQHTANRIDVELGSKLYSHLLHVPISYFETRAAGVIVTRVRELQSIRAFLTGQAVLSIIDLLFITIYLFVLVVYSPILTCIVLASIPFYILIGLSIRPMLRRVTKAKFRAFSRAQQLMVESIVGIQTVKALAVEPLFERRWEDRIAAYAQTSFEAALLSVKATTIVSLVTKLTSATILFVGFINVISGSMTIGGLIAFNIISRLIAKPIMRISTLYQSFQQVQVSIEHVADIFDVEVEPVDRATATKPELEGQITFKDVSFRYRPELPPVIKNISFEIAPGEVIGIVGTSGAGKSTLTKLLQRFHTPTSGAILIDGVDIAQVDPAWLRSQLGVVLQDNFLFNQTVRENIAIGRPDMPRGQVIRVAALAGADEFISQLPQGYDTLIEERGANLSGGQRQRLAIARALATDPRILVFDEATSALDYESERIIQGNMNRIVQDRTVIIISHRLVAVRNCDRIIGMAKGEIVEVGTHEQLLRRRGGLYAHLWSLQSENVS